MEPRHACRVAVEERVLYFLLADVRLGMLRLRVVAYASLRGRSAFATIIQQNDQHCTSPHSDNNNNDKAVESDKDRSALQLVFG